MFIIRLFLNLTIMCCRCNLRLLYTAKMSNKNEIKYIYLTYTVPLNMKCGNVVMKKVGSLRYTRTRVSIKRSELEATCEKF
jgi:hypothetical protein